MTLVGSSNRADHGRPAERALFWALLLLLVLAALGLGLSGGALDFPPAVTS